MPTLAGERDIEYNYVQANLPPGDGLVLDLGPDPTCKASKIALSQGWEVLAVGTDGVSRNPKGFTFVCADFMRYRCKINFDWTLNISTIEHFGLSGRYGVTVDEPDLDLAAMQKLRDITSRMILTVPIGVDKVFLPWHRVYGPERLPLLLNGWQVNHEQCWAKLRDNRYEVVDRKTAFLHKPTVEPFYYAVGTFILEATQRETVLHHHRF